MNQTHRIWSLLLALLLIGGCFACRQPGSASDGGEAICFDFSVVEDGIPSGWRIESYEGEYNLLLADGAIGFETLGADDIRFLRTVEVEPKTRYVLTAQIRTEGVRGGQGATLSVDNFSVDGSFIYSDALFGTNDWTPVTLAFRTANEQYTATLALRLGGYSAESDGAVWFRDVRFEQTDHATVAFQNLTPNDYESEEPERTVEDYENVFTVIFWAGVIAAIALLFGVWRSAKPLTLDKERRKEKYWVFPIIVLIGLIVRILLCAKLKGHATDLVCWKSWGYHVATDGPYGFYSRVWCDYPPGYMLVCGLLYGIEQLLPADQVWMRTFVYMTVPFLCDVLSGWLLLYNAKRFGIGDRLALLLSGLIVLNPAAVYLSGAWGQIDSVFTVMLIGVFLLLNASREKPYYRLFAGLLYGAAVLMKWQALIFGPVLALMYISSIVDQHGTKRFAEHIIWTVAAVAGAVTVILLGTTLFVGRDALGWIVSQFTSALGGYERASVEAYNFHTLFGGNWAHIYPGDDPTSLTPYPMFGSASVGEIFLKCNELFSKVALLIGFTTLILRAWNEMRTRSEDRSNHAFLELLAAGCIACLIGFLRFLAASFTSNVPFVRGLLWFIEQVPLYGVLMIAVTVVGMLRERGDGELSDWLKKGSAAAIGTLTLFLAACVFGLTFLLAMALKLLGGALTWKLFGVIGIAAAGVLTVALFLIYWRKHVKARYSLYVNRGLIFLLAAFFMVGVFTFGHKMHERYIFPVLFFLAFAYAYDRDPHKLAAFCMFTVTAFLNEMTAMYVVSEGAIDMIRGGAIHNRMIALVSLLEVCAAIYFTAACFRSAFAFDPSDPAGEKSKAEQTSGIPDGKLG